MLTLAPGTRILTDSQTGAGTLISRDGVLWTLSTSAVTALAALQSENEVAAAETALCARYPWAPKERIRADVDALLAMLQGHGVVVQS